MICHPAFTCHPERSEGPAFLGPPIPLRVSSPLNRIFPRNACTHRQIYFPRNCPKRPSGVAILKLGARDGNDPRDPGLTTLTLAGLRPEGVVPDI